MVRYAIAIASLLLAPQAFRAEAEQWDLQIEGPGSAEPPLLIIDSDPSTPAFDVGGNLWRAPLRTESSSFAVPYVVDTADVNAVRLEVPTQGLHGHQTVFVAPPTLTSIDERTIRELWLTNRITDAPRDKNLQFQLLQNLIYAGKELRKRQQPQEPIAINSTNVRASYLLLQVVSNLARHTWYVIDPSSEDAIEWAADVVDLSNKKGYACRWISQCGKKGQEEVSGLIKTVRTIKSQHASKMYEQLVPPKSVLDPRFCDKRKVESLESFLKFVIDDKDDRASDTGLNEFRVANDIAACRAARALCAAPSRDDATAELEAAQRLLDLVGTSETVERRRFEIASALRDVKAGNQVFCPISKKEHKFQ